MIAASKILSLDEIAIVTTRLESKWQKSKNARMNLAIFRLACLGLRCMEIQLLQMRDIHLATTLPEIQLRTGCTKGGKPRVVSLSWDKTGLECLKRWEAIRDASGALATDPVICRQAARSRPGRMCTTEIAKRFKTAVRCLGAGRVRQLHIHCGRHSFVSHLMVAGAEMPVIRDAAGHASISVQNDYCHPTGRAAAVALYDDV